VEGTDNLVAVAERNAPGREENDGGISRGGNFQISKNGKHMATGNSLVDTQLMIDLHENYIASQQLPSRKKW
jgi:hypothetical protein